MNDPKKRPRKKARAPSLKIHLTKARVAGLPVPVRGRPIVYDTRVPGFAVRLTPKDVRTLILYRKIGGRPQIITLGRFPGLRVEKARELAEELNGQIARGENPHTAKKKTREEMTLGALFDSYLKNHLKPNRNTWKAEQARYDRHLKTWGGQRVSAITRQEVRALHSRVGKKHGGYAANRLLQLIRAMYNHGAPELDNPGRGIKLHHEVKRERFLHPHELPGFFKAIADEQSETIRDYVLLSLLTGARRGNVLAMRWEEVDFELATWTIPAGKSKNRDPVTLPLHAAALDILKTRQKGGASAWVLPGAGRAGHLAEPKTGWARICKRAGVKGLRLHDLRRTLGSWQAARGASLTVIGKSLGHRNISTTAIYARLNLDPVRESVDGAVNDMLVAAGVKKPAKVAALRKGKKRR